MGIAKKFKISIFKPNNDIKFFKLIGGQSIKRARKKSQIKCYDLKEQSTVQVGFIAIGVRIERRRQNEYGYARRRDDARVTDRIAFTIAVVTVFIVRVFIARRFIVVIKL